MNIHYFVHFMHTRKTGPSAVAFVLRIYNRSRKANNLTTFYKSFAKKYAVCVLSTLFFRYMAPISGDYLCMFDDFGFVWFILHNLFFIIHVNHHCNQYTQ